MSSLTLISILQARCKPNISKAPFSALTPTSYTYILYVVGKRRLSSALTMTGGSRGVLQEVRRERVQRRGLAKCAWSTLQKNAVKMHVEFKTLFWRSLVQIMFQFLFHTSKSPPPPPLPSPFPCIVRQSVAAIPSPPELRPFFPAL